MVEPPASEHLHVAERGGDAALLDGSTIRLQPLTTDDREDLVDFFASLSPQSSRFRFLGTVGRLKGALLDRLLDLDPERAFAYVATRGGEIVATASAHRELNAQGDPLARAEVAFAVRDDLQHLGVGMLMLELLASHARRVGITSFTAITASDNDAMIGVFRSAGFDASIHRDPHDATTIMVEFSIDDDAASSDARWRREQRAVAASLQPLLRPTSIAVVGVSRDPHSVGRRVLQELVGNGFAGRLVPVNPKATVIDGLPVVASVADISEPVDLAVIAVPSAAVIGVVEECARCGVRAVMVLSAGFAETGPEGAARQRELLRVTRAGGMRLVGPNCLGIVTADASVSMHAVFTPLDVREGSIALMSQSGAVAMAIASLAAAMDTGFSSIVSVGNKADVSGNDLLEYWDQDPSTRVITMYLESFGNPRKFARIARRVSRTKPIIAIKAGRSSAGSAAAASHTGALMAADSTVDALFEQAGVLRVDEPSELLSLASALEHLPLPSGRRVAIIGNAGGLAILAADALEREQLIVATLEPATVERLRGFAPANAALHNPVDLTAGASTAQMGEALVAVLGDAGVDAVMVVLVNLEADDHDAFRAALAPVVGDGSKPVLTVFGSAAFGSRQIVPRGVEQATNRPADHCLPTATTTREAAMLFARMVQRAEWLRRDDVPARPIGAEALSSIRDLVATQRSARASGWCDAVASSKILALAGIRVNEPVLAVDESAAITAARLLGYPVCLKAADPDLVHKSDRGAVQLGLVDDESVRVAYRSLTSTLGKEHGLIVQAMAVPGVEMLVGIMNDPSFGPLVVVGSGGHSAELWRDTATHLAPLSTGAALDMVHSLRSRRLLEGFRGSAACDVDALVDVIVRLGHLADEVPDIIELDANPVIVTSDGAIAVDVKIRVASSGESADPLRAYDTDLRFLRPI